MRIREDEAKSRLGHLLDLVEAGEEVTIIRRGRKVAKLVPADACRDRAEARAAIDRLRQRAEQLKAGTFDWAAWKGYRDEGRR